MITLLLVLSPANAEEIAIILGRETDDLLNEYEELEKRGLSSAYVFSKDPDKVETYRFQKEIMGESKTMHQGLYLRLTDEW